MQSACLSWTSTGSWSEAGEEMMRSVALFLRGTVPGLKYQLNCDLLSLLHESVGCSPHPCSFRGSSQKISSCLCSVFLLFFPCFLNSYPFSRVFIITPNITIYHSIKAQRSFSLLVPADAIKSDEGVRQKEKWEDQRGEKLGNMVNKMTMSVF